MLKDSFKYKTQSQLNALIISLILHPALMPIYTAAIIIWGNSIFSLITPKSKLLIISILFLRTITIPLCAIFLLRTLKVIKSFDLHNKRDRFITLIIGVLCYLMFMFDISKLLGSNIANILVIGIMINVFIFAVITLFWQISLHMMGMGSALAVLYVITLNDIGNFTIWIIILTLLSGLLASCRLFLGRHNIWQILTGFTIGAANMAITLII